MLARRSPLRRSSPLRRTSSLTRSAPLRAVSRKNSYRKRERDFDFMAFVRWCHCALKADEKFPCAGRVEADHAGERAKSKKAPDTTCIPLCHRHHRHRTDYVGHFKGWDGQRMRAWCDGQISFYRTLYTNLVAMGRTPWRTMAA